MSPILRAALLSFLVAVLLPGCASTGQFAPQIAQRNAAIAAEPQGDYFIGRRCFIDRTQFWGYLRRPGQSWDRSKLVIFSEKLAKVPDRLPEAPSSGLARGHDHNWEYKIWGYYSGAKVYDPNSDLILPEFVLQRYEVINRSPGWLFEPGERFKGDRLLRAEPELMP